MDHIKPTMGLMKPPRAHVDQGGEYFGENPFYASVYTSTNGVGNRKRKSTIDNMK
jgi:hypothetical protein